ncbi:hypothetical protein BDV09DRAFT_26275 [Aspergillus tetrazonus]
MIIIALSFTTEVFCRVPDCSKATKKFSATNNLHTYIKTHDGMKLEEGNTGGRVAQKVVDRAVCKLLLLPNLTALQVVNSQFRMVQVTVFRH